MLGPFIFKKKSVATIRGKSKDYIFFCTHTHIHIYIFITYFTCSLYIFHMRSIKYQPVFHTLYFTLHRAHVLNMAEILDGRVSIANSVERIRM